LGHRFLSKTRDASLPSSRGREQVPRGGAIPATVLFTREMDFMRRTVGQLIVTSTMTSVEPRAFNPSREPPTLAADDAVFWRRRSGGAEAIRSVHPLSRELTEAEPWPLF
jgi:hypothetical protein